jgi:hypothetical protein
MRKVSMHPPISVQLFSCKNFQAIWIKNTLKIKTNTMECGNTMTINHDSPSSFYTVCYGSWQNSIVCCSEFIKKGRNETCDYVRYLFRAIALTDLQMYSRSNENTDLNLKKKSLFVIFFPFLLAFSFSFHFVACHRRRQITGI